MWDDKKQQLFDELRHRKLDGSLTEEEQQQLDRLSEELDREDEAYLRPAFEHSRKRQQELDAEIAQKEARNMTKKRSKTAISLSLEEVTEQAEKGIDVSEHFSGQHLAKQFVSIDFPLELLHAIDTECRQVGVTRQAWIKMACDERLRQIQSGRLGSYSFPSQRA